MPTVACAAIFEERGRICYVRQIDSGAHQVPPGRGVTWT